MAKYWPMATQSPISAICIANFDHELGMVLEEILPENALSKQDNKTIAMLSFPESNSTTNEWSHTFLFRFRHKSDQIVGEYYYLFGYAHFIQRKVIGYPRGYWQKTFVIISPFNSPVYFTQLAKLMGNIYFANVSKETSYVL